MGTLEQWRDFGTKVYGSETLNSEVVYLKRKPPRVCNSSIVYDFPFGQMIDHTTNLILFWYITILYVVTLMYIIVLLYE